MLSERDGLGNPDGFQFRRFAGDTPAATDSIERISESERTAFLVV